MKRSPACARCWLADPAEIAAFPLEAELEASWRSLRELKLSGSGVPADLPADAEPWEPDPGPPYEQWPGLASAVATAEGTGSNDVPRLVLADLLSAPANADIPAVMAWNADVSHVRLSALLRSWGDRFGARAVAFHGARIYVSVARPPRTAAHAAHVALEHVLTGAGNVNEGWPPFADYAANRARARFWPFWWDSPSRRRSGDRWLLPGLLPTGLPVPDRERRVQSSSPGKR